MKSFGKEPAFIGQINTGQNQRLDVYLRTVKMDRLLTFTPIDTSGEEARRGYGGLIIDVSQLPHLQTLVMNAMARARLDGPLDQKAAHAL